MTIPEFYLQGWFLVVRNSEQTLLKTVEKTLKKYINTESTGVWGRGIRNPIRFKCILKNLPLSVFHLEKQNAAEDYLSFFCGNTPHCNLSVSSKCT